MQERRRKAYVFLSMQERRILKGFNELPGIISVSYFNDDDVLINEVRH